MLNDRDKIPDTATRIIEFPKAEYLHIIGIENLGKIPNLQLTIADQLEKIHLSQIGPTLITPAETLPGDFVTPINLDIWVPTSADFNNDERLSDNIPEALPRKRFNFYTW